MVAELPQKRRSDALTLTPGADLVAWARASGIKPTPVLRLALSALAGALPGSHPQKIPTRAVDAGDGVVMIVTADDPGPVAKEYEARGMTVTILHTIVAVVSPMEVAS